MARTGTGLSLILPATVIASALGLLVQIIVPLVRPAEDYVDFSLFWSTLFFAVAAASGVQQELSRAARPAPASADARRELTRYVRATALTAALVALVIAGVVVVIVAPAGAVSFVVWLSVGIGAYVILAAAVGTSFGAQHWRAAALGMFADPAVRAVTLGAVALAVALWAFAPSADVLYAATAVPFVVAAAVMAIIVVRRGGAGFALDAPAPVLWRNTLHTVLASSALGLISIGLPLLVRLIADDLSASALAGALLVITLARAPLVSPALALQSMLTVSFRADPATRTRRTLVFAALILAAGIVLAVLAVVLVPPVMAALVPDYGVPSTIFIAVVVGSSALVAAQCVTGAALLSAGDHRRYAAGWVATAIAAVVCALVPLPFEWRVGVLLVAAPAIGLVVHGVAMRRQRSAHHEPHQA